MRKIAIAFVGVAVAGLLGFFVYRDRREAEEQRATAIRECATWPELDEATCELYVENGRLEEKLQVAAHVRLSALRADVVSARAACTDLDQAIGYVALGDRATRGTLTPEQEKTSRQLLAQGFECERLAGRASIEFRDAQQALADKQRAAGYQVTVNGVQLPDFDTPAIEALKAENPTAPE